MSHQERFFSSVVSPSKIHLLPLCREHLSQQDYYLPFDKSLDNITILTSEFLKALLAAVRDFGLVGCSASHLLWGYAELTALCSGWEEGGYKFDFDAAEQSNTP